jgi:hypothetical protein
VASINVHDDVGEVERLKSIRDTLLVASSRVLAGLEVDVGDQVGQGIGLDDQSNGDVGILLEDGDNGFEVSASKLQDAHDRRLTVNVLGLVDVNLADSKLAVGSLSSAIATG